MGIIKFMVVETTFLRIMSTLDQTAYRGTLIQPVIERALRDPERLAVAFIEDDGRDHLISALQFHTQAMRYARALQAIHVGPEDLVILVLHHSQTLLFAFWGAMYLGAIASIFPFLTEKLDPHIYMERVKELVTHAQVRAVITFPEFKSELSALLAGAGCTVLSSAEVAENPQGGSLTIDGLLPAAGQAPAQPITGNKIAFLQHSSGTTGLQKGVALSHRAVLNQIEAYSQAIRLTPEDVIVSWLPLYHDMGLIAGFVMPLVSGVPLVLMSPFKWVRDPKVLMHAIHRYRATLCWLPNFAYNHSARAIRPRDLEGIDLSSMRAFINCSEPVFHDSHQVFLQKFAPYGLRPETLATCYAMAENTFAVTQSPPGEAARLDWVNTRAQQEQRLALTAPPEAPGATVMVSCGAPIADTQVQVVDDHGQRLGERQVGEIILRSNCMLSGYYRRPEITRQAIRSGWYYTGDMGYLADGEVYITGRKKDLIIVGGKNIYPQDLEAIANLTPGLVPGRSVAFGLADKALGSENVVMVCEVENAAASDEEKHQIEMELRQRVVARSEVALSDVRLVGKRWLIKTSSGKISRSANRDKYIREFLSS